MNWVYMIECKNGSYYTGFTVNMVRRYWQHANGLAGAKYTAAFKPRALICCWQVFGTRGDSMRIEAYIKGMGRAFKEKIAENPGLLEKIADEQYGIAISSFNASLVAEGSAVYTKADYSKDFDPLAQI